MSLPLASIPKGMVLKNGGARCDMLLGPCSCGAWHGIKTWAINNQEEIMRIYIFFLINEGKKNGTIRI